MFFIFSKILSFLIEPLYWIIFFGVIGLFSKSKRKKKYSFLSFGLLIFFTNPLFINIAMNAWEIPLSSLKDDAVYDVAIVLGGFSRIEAEPKDRLHFYHNANRLTNVIELYKEGKVKKILITGGTSFYYDKHTEADLASLFLQKIGIPKSDILIENKSRNTAENAKFTAQILKENFPNSKLLLVTSAFHMRRSRACFHKATLLFDIYPTDKIGSETNWYPKDIIMPQVQAMQNWNILIREWLGILVYKLKGYA